MGLALGCPLDSLLGSPIDSVASLAMIAIVAVGSEVGALALLTTMCSKVIPGTACIRPHIPNTRYTLHTKAAQCVSALMVQCGTISVVLSVWYFSVQRVSALIYTITVDHTSYHGISRATKQAPYPHSHRHSDPTEDTSRLRARPRP